MRAVKKIQSKKRQSKSLSNKEQKSTEQQKDHSQRQLESLVKILQADFPTVQEFLDFALEEALILTGSRIGYIYFYDQDNEEFILNSWSKDVMPSCTVTNPQTCYQLSKTGIWGEAVRQRKPIVLNDFQSFDPLKKGYPDGHAHLSKYLTIPVFSGNNIVAVVAVANKATDYDQSDILELTILMDSVWKVVDRKKAVEKLHESEILFRRLFDNMLNGFAYCKMLYDKGCPSDFVYLSVNKAFESQTGLMNVSGKKVSEVIPGFQKSDSGLLERYGRVASTGVPELFEIYVDSLKMWFSISVYCPLKDHFVAVFDVISERKRTFEILKESEEFSRRIIESSNDCIKVLDLQGNLLSMSDGGQKKLEIDDINEYLNKSWVNFWKGKDKEGALKAISKAKTGYPEIFTGYCATEKGTPKWWEIIISPIKDSYGNIYRLLAVSRDITERKNSEKTISESERRLREAQEMAHLGFWSWDVKTGIVEWSEEVFKIFHLDPVNFTPQIDSIMALSPWDDYNQRDKELINRAISTHTPGDFEQKFLRPDGSTGHYNSTFQGRYNENGDLVGIVGTVLDITDRKKAEEEIRESNEYLTNLINYANAPIIVWNTSLIITLFNHAFERLSGYLEEEVLGKNIEILFSERKSEYSLDLINRAIKGERWETVEIEIKRKDGDTRIVLWNSANIFDKEGKNIVATIAQGNDITDRKIFEKKLSESEDKFKYIFDHSVIAKSITLPAGEIHVNRAFCEMTGYSSIELENKKWQEISHPGDISLTEKIIGSLITGEKKSARFIKRYIHKNGSVIWTDVATALRRNTDGEPLYFMTAIIDITERITAEEALRLKNLVFDASIAANSIADINGIITEVNDSFLKVWGYPDKDKVIGIAISDFMMHTEEADAILTSLQNAGEWEGDYCAKRRDGSTFIAHGLATIVKDETGKTIGFQSSVLDVTGPRQAEKDLNLIANRQEAILSAVPDIIMEVDNDKKYTWSNHSGFKFFGEDVIGKDASFYFEGEQETYKNVQPLFDGSNDIIYLESWQRRKDGMKRMLAWWCRTLRDENGIVTGALSTARDITESKKLTENIEEERNKLSCLLSSIPDEVWFADSNKKFTLANPNALLEFGLLSTDNLDIEKFAEELEVFLPDGTSRPLEMAPPLRALEGEIIKNFEEIVFIPGKKELRHRQVNAAPVKDSAGKIIGAISVVRDITELKESDKKIKQLNEQLEQRVIERTEQLEAANKELEAFSYSVSHDLRAPLRAVHSYTKILLEEYENKLDEEGKRLFGIVYSSASQMGDLIDDLLNLSRIGRSSMTFSWIDMKKIVCSVFDELFSQNEIGKKKIIFCIEKLYKASGDNILIKQVWVNLLSNAIKYSSKKDKPEIKVGSHIRDNMIIYFIRDNGVGFDMTYKHKLFGVFQRLHTEKEFEGNGVGLAIVQRIINRHGGKVWAESEVGKGATFYFSLPVVGKTQLAVDKKLVYH